MTTCPTPSVNSERETALPAIPPGVRLITLENGLTLILQEDHSAPVVSAQAWCRAGSIDEGKWLGAGLSHILEHMLFKGTATRPASRIDQEVQEAGGYMNAYTSFDRTVYWINVPNTGAHVAVDILCDIMQHAVLPGDELAKEMDVIRREMDMNHDDPGQKSARRLFEVAYTRSPYRFTIIGYPDIFNDVRREDLHAYYVEKYAPNNIFFVVVGDMNAAEIEQQIRTAFASSKTKPMPPGVLPLEPSQTAPREVIEEGPIELGYCHFSWHIPEMRHADVPILDVLAVLLGGGRSSRLYQQVRERQGIVTSVDAWTYNPGNPGLFGVSATLEPEHFEAARQAMLAELERMKAEPVSAAEMSKAVKQFIAGTLSIRKSMQGQAQDLGGSWMTASDLNFSARYLDAVKRITPADLQRVARQYLTTENRTFYALLPKGAAPVRTYQPDAMKEGSVKMVTLANGLRLLIKEDSRLPFVEFRAVFKGGVLAEAEANNGITVLLAKMLMQGTTTRTAAQIAAEIEGVGGHIDTYGGQNSLGVSAEVLSSDFALGLDLMADLILRPSFPTDELERERLMQLSAIRAQKDDLLPSAGRLMRRALFGPKGYGLPAQGEEASVERLTVPDLRSFHQRLLVPNNCVLAVYGDVKASEAQAAIDKILGAWPPGSDPLAQVTAIVPGPRSSQVLEMDGKKQAVLVMGFPGLSIFDPRRHALELVQESCSDLGSRLFLRIREELGLAYFVGAQNMPGLIPGFFAFYVGTDPAKVDQVESELLREAETLSANGLTPEELKRAKAKIIGQKKIARQDLGGLASTMALDELYGLGYQHTDKEDGEYEKVTVADTIAVARAVLRAESVIVATIRPKSATP